MEKEDLKKYREKLEKLDENEKKLRDIHLSKLANGTIQGPNVGYLTIDKPCLKYYDEESISKDFEPLSAYQLMHKCNLGYEDELAIEYFGTKITYGKLFKKIDEAAKALLEMGLKKGDVALVSMPCTPEAEILFYALNKIGVVADCLDPRSGVETFKEECELFNIKYVFSIDVMYDKVKMIDKDVNIINISPYISMLVGLKQVASMKAKKCDIDERTIDYTSFIKKAKNYKGDEIEAVYEPNKVAAVVHTGGTTGTPKGVKLTNEEMNGLIYQMKYGYKEFKRGQRFLNFIPISVALGLNNSTHLSACFGLHSYMIPSFEPEDMPKMLVKYKPNIFLCGPMHLTIIMRDKEVQESDLSFLDVICSGGEKLPLKTQEDFQKFLEDHNSNAKVWIGYGATETSAGIACMKDECFTYESVGVPYLKNVVGIFDPDTKEELYGNNVVGEICVNAPTIMDGYSGKYADETKEVIKIDENNNKWYCTGDIGYIKDGLIYINGRMKQAIMRRAFKIYPATIEKVILESEYVKECCVVGVLDEDEFRIPVANIVLKDEYKDSEEIKQRVIEYVDNVINDTMPDYCVLAAYNFIDILPRTGIGKVDFKKLEERGIDSGEKRTLKYGNFIN